MTSAELGKFVQSYELAAPVTMEDLREIFNDIKPKLAADISLSVILRGGTPQDTDAPRVEVTTRGGTVFAPVNTLHRIAITA